VIALKSAPADSRKGDEFVKELQRDVGAGSHGFVGGAFDVHPRLAILKNEMRAPVLGRFRRTVALRLGGTGTDGRSRTANASRRDVLGLSGDRQQRHRDARYQTGLHLVLPYIRFHRAAARPLRRAPAFERPSVAAAAIRERRADVFRGLRGDALGMGLEIVLALRDAQVVEDLRCGRKRNASAKTYELFHG